MVQVKDFDFENTKTKKEALLFITFKKSDFENLQFSELLIKKDLDKSEENNSKSTKILVSLIQEIKNSLNETSIIKENYIIDIEKNSYRFSYFIFNKNRRYKSFLRNNLITFNRLLIDKKKIKGFNLMKKNN